MRESQDSGRHVGKHHCLLLRGNNNLPLSSSKLLTLDTISRLQPLAPSVLSFPSKSIRAIGGPLTKGNVSGSRTNILASLFTCAWNHRVFLCCHIAVLSEAFQRWSILDYFPTQTSHAPVPPIGHGTWAIPLSHTSLCWSEAEGITFFWMSAGGLCSIKT